MNYQDKELQTKKYKYIKGKLDIAAIMLLFSVIQLFIMKYYYTFLEKKDPFSITFGSYLILPFIIIFLFNIYFIRIHFLIMQLEPFKDWEIKKILLIWFSIVSIPRFFLDAAAISDILSEHLTGIWDCSGELFALQVLFYIHLVYYIYLGFMLIICFIYLKKNQDKDIYLYNENNYKKFNKIGIISGLSGLVVTIILNFSDEPVIRWKWLVLPLSIALLSPYFLYIINWFLSINKNKRNKLFDEKQKYDLYKAGIITHILSIPILMIFYYLNYNNSGSGNILWLPFYFFSTILILSSLTIYFYTKKS